MEESKSSMFAFMKGLVLGAVAALLFAPKSGKETREAISSTAHDVKQKAQQTGEQVKEKVHRGVEVAKDKGGRTIEAIKNANQEN